MTLNTIWFILIAGYIAWELDMEKPVPYPLGNGDTLMVRTVGYEFCPQYCDIDHFHFGHKKIYDCGVEVCTHIIYEDRLN